MKILSLGLDNSILQENSQLRERVFDYASLVDKYFVVVPNKEYSREDLNEKISVLGSGGNNKVFQIFKIYNLSKKIIKENSFDVITVQDQYYLSLVGWLLAKKYRIALEIQVHGFEKFSGLRKIIAKSIIKKADEIRVVSQRLKSKLIEEFRVDEDKVTVVPIFSKKLEIKNERLKRDRNDNFIFLTVSRFVPVKNIEMQIEAMRNIVNKYPNTELWLVGDGPLRDNLQLSITNYELDEKIKMLGWVDNQGNLDKIYSQADCFVLTSDSEGWGIAVIDAASHGLPIIMTDVGLAGEVIKNNESGLVISVGDQKALEEAMIRIIEDKDLRKKLGKGARLAVENLPDKEETLKMYLEGWKNAMKNKNEKRNKRK